MCESLIILILFMFLIMVCILLCKICIGVVWVVLVINSMCEVVELIWVICFIIFILLIIVWFLFRLLVVLWLIIIWWLYGFEWIDKIWVIILWFDCLVDEFNKVCNLLFLWDKNCSCWSCLFCNNCFFLSVLFLVKSCLWVCRFFVLILNSLYGKLVR